MVTTPGGSFTSPGGFTYVAPPTITSIAPVVGPLTAGTVITIGGTNLTGTSAVTFGGTPGTSIVNTSATAITVVVPAHAAGAVDVVVTTPGGSFTSPGGFTYADAPTITTQPASLTVTVGQTATFLVAASGTAPFTYQWRLNGSPISGATSASFTTAATTLDDDGKIYSVLVSNPVGSVLSADATLNISLAPAFTTQPQDAVMTAGQTATFTVAAGGLPTPSLQWERSNDWGATWNPIANATTTTYATTTALSDNGAWFRCLATNGQANATSAVAALAVGDGTNLIVNGGAETGTTTGWLVTGGAQTVEYGTPDFPTITGPGPAQRGAWFFSGGSNDAVSTLSQTIPLSAWNGVIAAGRAECTLAAFLGGYSSQDDNAILNVDFRDGNGVSLLARTLGPITAADRGSVTGLISRQSVLFLPTSTASAVVTVTCTRVSGSWNDAYIDAMSLVLADKTPPAAPVIDIQPGSVSVNVGQTATFVVAATGTAPLTYQWLRNGQAISDATANLYTTPATTSADNGARFSVMVTNAAGSITSDEAVLTVNEPPAITSQPQDITVTAGQTATFTVTATGTAPLSYQWSRNGQVISGATSASYTTPPTSGADSGAIFAVTITNAAGTMTSGDATLTVNVPPTIATQPVSATVIVGQTATFTVSATGTAPLTYQWSRNSQPIPGATAATYSTPATVLTDDGATFAVTVSNLAGTAVSISATLSVIEPPLPPIDPLAFLLPDKTAPYQAVVGETIRVVVHDGNPPYTLASSGATVIAGAQLAATSDLDGDQDLDPGQTLVVVPTGTGAGSITVTDRDGTVATISLSVTQLPSAANPLPTIPVTTGETTVYAAICPGTSAGLTSLRQAMAGRDSTVARLFSWDALTQAFVEFPAEPAGGLAPSDALFLAAREALPLDFDGSPAPLPYAILLRPGWNFVGLPPLTADGGQTVIRRSLLDATTADDFVLNDPTGAVLARSGNLDGAYWWDGAAYRTASLLECGKGYWIRNLGSQPLFLRRLHTGIVRSLAGSGPLALAGKAPPAPPAAAVQSSGKTGGGCGSGGGVALLGLALAALLSGRRRR